LDDSTNVHDAAPPLGYDQQVSAKLKCDDNGEYHAEEASKYCGSVASRESLQHKGEDLKCKAPDSQDNDQGNQPA
jgi:hypothetical protein